MSILNNVYRAVRSWNEMWNRPGKDVVRNWWRYHPQDWKIVQEWTRMKDGI